MGMSPTVVDGRAALLMEGRTDDMRREAVMAGTYAKLSLGPAVLGFREEDRRARLVVAAPAGTLACSPGRLDDPERLAETMGAVLAELHRPLHLADARAVAGDGLPDASPELLLDADKALERPRMARPGLLLAGAPGDPIEAAAFARDALRDLGRDVLVHGCFGPDCMFLDGWTFSGFVHVGRGGCGDPAIDLFGAAMSLRRLAGGDGLIGILLDAYGATGRDADMLAAMSCLAALSE